MLLRKVFSILLTLLLVSCADQKLEFPQETSNSLENASLIIKGSKIEASTGMCQRTWELTPYGLATSHLSLMNGPNLIRETGIQVDWNFQADSLLKGELLSVETRKDNDEGFTTNGLVTDLTFSYPQAGIELKYRIRIWPNAPGFHTQLFLRKTADSNRIIETADMVVEQLPLPDYPKEIWAAGYFNDTQHRNSKETPILKESKIPASPSLKVDWASLVSTTLPIENIIMVKESHKCVNQKGVNTGGFRLTENALQCYGAGLNKESLTKEFQPCWATWTILYNGDNLNRQYALKSFDRFRYPIDPKRDIYIMANTWGSTTSAQGGRHAARESNIQKEIDSQKDLGIDVQQIDDGWQGTNYKNWKPVPEAKSKEMGQYVVYPKGWDPIRQYAKEQEIKLGLWAAWTIPYEDLLWNYKNGGFRYYKLDFSNLKDYPTLHGFMSKIRNFVLATNQQVRVNWDVTENPPRIGYYFAREYGNIYLENRKPERPANVLYHPWLVLRDAWHVAHYTNLNKFQVSVQNKDRVNRELSDAYLYSHPYTVAISLMGSPIFFQETKHYNQQAREEIKPILKAYKAHRDDLYKGFVFPIGEEPTNSSWAGFINTLPNGKTAYIMLFRERLNKEKTKQIQLPYWEKNKVSFSNLLTGEKWTAQGKDGKYDFTLKKPGSFLFLKVEKK